MTLQTLLASVEYSLIQGSIQTEIEHLTEDSKTVQKNSLFFCRHGLHTDGKHYLEEALDQGASAIICEAVDDEVLEILLRRGTCAVAVRRIETAMQAAAARFYGDPQKKLSLIGVTGTKGKTTVSMLLYQLLQATKHKTLLIGTNGILADDEKRPATHTTPPLLQLYEELARGVEKGCTVAVIEVSSLAVKQRRIEGLDFSVGIYTNFYPDHVGPGEHASLEEYRHWKECFLRGCRRCIVNLDDSWGRELKETLSCPTIGYSQSEPCDCYAKNIVQCLTEDFWGSEYELAGCYSEKIRFSMPGRFNVSNSLAAAAAADIFQVPADVLKQVYSRAGVKGRCEVAGSLNDAYFVVDYAHNESSLEAVLTMVREYRPGRIICMFGCGGERSRLRRIGMGRISARMADLTVITQDNSRNEPFSGILSDIMQGVEEDAVKCVVIPDRAEAIRYCTWISQPGDFILLIGKGHEEYQESRGRRVPFSDVQTVKEILEKERLKQ